MFESIEEVDQIETEPKNEEAKHVPKMPNGALQNGTSSPDSGHPSSRNFSVTSGLSDGSLSTEDSAAPDTTQRSAAVPQVPQSLVKPAGVKSQSLPEDSQVKRKVKDHKEEEEEAPDVTNTAENTKAEVTGENVIQPLEEGMEKESKTQETVEDSGATKTKEMDESKSSKPEVVLLAERKKNISLDRMAPEDEKNLIFSADTGVTRAREAFFTSQRDEPQVMTESDESPSAIEMEEIPKAKVSMVPWSRKGRCEAPSLSDDSAPHVELRQEEEQGKPSPEGTESILSEEPEMESLYTNFDSLAGSESTKNEATSQESAGNTFSVCAYIYFFIFYFYFLFKLIYPLSSIMSLFYLFIPLLFVSARAFRLVHIKSAPHRKGCPALRQKLLLLHSSQFGETAQHHVQVSIRGVMKNVNRLTLPIFIYTRLKV